MEFYRDTENYAWINMDGNAGFNDYISQDEYFNQGGAGAGGAAVIGDAGAGGGAVIANNGGAGAGAGGAFPSCASTMNQCPCSYGGCMDNGYMEYDANATCDNGSCTTPIVSGCMSQSAINYNPGANMDDGSCIGAISGCTDVNATNYNAQANTDCSGNIVQAGGGGGGGAQQQQQQQGNLGFNGYANAAGKGRYLPTGINSTRVGDDHPVHWQFPRSGNRYRNACGNTYSNFNQQGFGGYNDKMWFND